MSFILTHAYTNKQKVHLLELQQIFYYLGHRMSGKLNGKQFYAHKLREEVIERMSLQLFESVGRRELQTMNRKRNKMTAPSRRGSITKFEDIDVKYLNHWIGIDYIRQISGDYIYFVHNVQFHYNESNMKLKATFEIARADRNNENVVLKPPSQ